MTNQTGQTLKTLSAALREIPDHVMVTSPQGVIEYVNPAFEATTGYASHEVVGQTPNVLRSGKHGEDYYHKLWTTILSGGVFRATTANKKKNGELYYADQTIAPIYDDDGEITFFVSIWKDATDRMLAEKKVQEERHKLEQVLGIEAELHSILELNKLIDFVVEKTSEVLEAEKCSLLFIDHDLGKLCIKGHRGIEEAFVKKNTLKMGDGIEHLAESCHQTKILQDASCKNPGKIDGTLYQSETFLSVPIELRDHVLGIMNVSHKNGKDSKVFTDLDFKILLMIVRQVRIAIENAKMYRELKYLTVTDPLTGIYNYRYFAQTLDYEIIRTKRYKRDLSVLMIDVDHFKSYNDTLGHVEGDALIKNIAKTISRNVRKADIVCRYGGDEFAVILPETNLAQAKIIAEKIRQKISELSVQRPVSLSIGAAQADPQMNRYDLMRKADSHLYEAKQKGKNQISG
jgi:diguanylate cyclase (GGDEF)-like protein/PAS domain S-box-containing protein